MGKAQAQLEYPRGLDFEQVWAAIERTRAVIEENGRQMALRIQETDRQIALQKKETDRFIKENVERQKETARQMQETDRFIKENVERQKETTRQMQETDRQIKEYNKRFGDFTRRFGEVVEYMIAPNLLKKFKEYGFKFLEAMPNRVISDDDNDISFEVDVFLQNGDKAMLVEVKTKLTTEDVKEHVERLEKMRTYADLHGDKRVFLGSVAGVVMTPHVKKYALEQGFYVIEPSGETFNITSPNSTPKEW